MVVVGSGIAGLTAALTVSPRARVAVVTKSALDAGASRWAQGGIAAAIGDDDSVELHFQDTVAAGRGLCDERAVRVLVEEGPARVRELAEWGAGFDSRDGELSLGREAAHTRNRIVHAGDQTGRAIETTLARRVRHSGVRVIADAYVSRLLRDDDGRCAGVELLGDDGRRRVIGAGAVILATGGAGRLWRNTTNPATATGDGVALAWAVGAEVANMEFMQFHPTALALPGTRSFLISEAMRGEGAHVVDTHGERFLFESDPLGELAGRDVVSRAIAARLTRDGTDHVLLDCRPLGAAVRERFPTITAACRDVGIDITEQPIPIAPAAHYLIGGVRTDVDGATNVPGLFAAGEVACTGVHGANRLASNSLLEGAVFGHRAAERALRDIGERRASPPRVPAAPGAVGREPVDDTSGLMDRLRDSMWDACGIVRDRGGLEHVHAASGEIAAATAGAATPDQLRIHRSATTAGLVCRSALLREESRGAHTRADFSSTRETWHGVIVMQEEEGHRFDRDA